MVVVLALVEVLSEGAVEPVVMELKLMVQGRMQLLLDSWMDRP